MRLNNDCIRDILLYIERNTTDEMPFINAENLINDLQQKYDKGTINYHVRQIDKAGLVDDVYYSEDEPDTISDLSWEGHNFINNIRDNNVWSKLKESTKHLGSVSLPVLIEKAPDIIKMLFP